MWYSINRIWCKNKDDSYPCDPAVWIRGLKTCEATGMIAQNFRLYNYKSLYSFIRPVDRLDYIRHTTFFLIIEATA